MYLEVFLHEEIFDICFKTINSNKKSMAQAVSSNTLKCKLRLTSLKGKLQEDRCRWCNYKLKCHKTTQITYLQENKQQTRYRITYLQVLRLEQGYGWCFERQTTAWKLIETFLGVINKQVRCTSCICNVKCVKKAIFDAFTSWNATKRYKEDI